MKFLSDAIRRLCSLCPKGRGRVRGTSSDARARRRSRSPLVLELLEPRVALSVNVQFDYSLDTNGFFTDPARRQVLQAAAVSIVGRLNDSLGALTDRSNDHLVIKHPGTELDHRVDRSIPADTLIIYAGGRDLPDTVLARANRANHVCTHDNLCISREHRTAGLVLLMPEDGC